MLLKAVTVESKPLLFGIEDVPVRLNKELIVLSARKGSPLLMRNTIVRGDSSIDIFEGDYAMKDGTNYIGKVIYDKGFKLLNKELQLEELPMENVKYVHNLYPSIEARDVDIKWCYNDSFVTVDDIVVKDGGKIILAGRYGKHVKVADLRLFTGLYINEKPLCFGDTHKAGVVVVKNGNICVQRLDGTHDVIREEGE